MNFTNVEEKTVFPSSPTQGIGKNKEKKRPTRAFSTYNVFFQLERAYIIQKVLFVHPDPKAARFDPEREGYAGPPLPSRYHGLVLPPEFHSSFKASKGPRRKHRKTHGKISFGDLSKMISKHWNKANSEVKEYCRIVSSMDRKNVNAQMGFSNTTAPYCRPPAKKNNGKSSSPQSDINKRNQFYLSKYPSDGTVAETILRRDDESKWTYPQYSNIDLCNRFNTNIGTVPSLDRSGDIASFSNRSKSPAGQFTTPDFVAHQSTCTSTALGTPLPSMGPLKKRFRYHESGDYPTQSPSPSFQREEEYDQSVGRSSNAPVGNDSILSSMRAIKNSSSHLSSGIIIPKEAMERNLLVRHHTRSTELPPSALLSIYADAKEYYRCKQLYTQMAKPYMCNSLSLFGGALAADSNSGDTPTTLFMPSGSRASPQHQYRSARVYHH